jgi:hypothetical protein
MKRILEKKWTHPVAADALPPDGNSVQLQSLLSFWGNEATHRCVLPAILRLPSARLAI